MQLKWKRKNARKRLVTTKATAIKTSLKKWIRAVSNFIPSRRLIQCNSTDKTEADGALIHSPLPPTSFSLSISAPFYGYSTLSEATRKGKESQKKDFRSHQGVDLGTSRTEGTNENQVFLPAQEVNHFLQQFCL